MKIHGAITRKNPKTIQVTTPDLYYVNIPAHHLTIDTILTQNLVDFRKSIAPINAEMHDLLKDLNDLKIFNKMMN